HRTVMRSLAPTPPGDRAAPPRTLPLHIPISVLFGVLIVLSATVLATVMYLRSARMLEEAGNDLAARSHRETHNVLERLLAPAGMAVRLFAQQPAAVSATEKAWLDTFGTALRANPSIEAFYVGTADGDFFLLRRGPGERAGQEGARPG